MGVSATALALSDVRGTEKASAEKPNIVLMLFDNVGYGDLGCYGNRLVKTPRIDHLAAEGVRCTGRIKPGTICREPLWSMDFVPLALHEAGLALPTDRKLDGKDPTDAWAGRSGSPHMSLCWQWGKTGFAIRMGRYKLIREQDTPQQDWQLFDLQTDIGEATDLRTTQPDITERLKTEYQHWLAEVAREKRRDDRTQEGSVRGRLTP